MKRMDTREWEQTPKTVTLTNAEWSTLTTYLLMSTRHRERELEAWEKLSKEKNPDGTPRFENAESNAEYWREMIAKLEQIRLKIDA